MNIKSSRERREQRAELTKQALADVVRAYASSNVGSSRRPSPAGAASAALIFRHYFAEKEMSLFIFLKLSAALGFEDACQLLRTILDCRDQRLSNGTEEHTPQ